MVAAAKLRRSQQAAQAARPYAERMAAIISNLAAGVSGPSAPLLLAGTGKEDRHLIVVATADRGLAGAFNSSIVRAARLRLAELVMPARRSRSSPSAARRATSSAASTARSSSRATRSA